MTFMHTPGVGVVWDSVNDPRYLGAVLYYPLKTSRCCVQFSCCRPCFLMASFHVAFTSLWSVGSRLFGLRLFYLLLVVNDSHLGELARVARGRVKGSIVVVVVDDSELCVMGFFLYDSGTRW